MKKDYKNLIIIVVFVFVLGISINVFADNTTTECTNIISQDFIDAMGKYVYTPIKYAVPVLLLVLTSLDFAQVVFAGKKENMEKAKNNFLKRAISGIIIFFAPDIINLVVSLVNNQAMSTCMNNIKNVK